MSAIDRQLMEEPIAMPIAAPLISMKVTHKKRRGSKSRRRRWCHAEAHLLTLANFR